MLELLTDPQAWIALLTLTALELVLGIDNIIFISILVARLPLRQREKARRLGLFLAMFMRIALLLTLSWIIGMTAPLFTILHQPFSGRDLVLIGGGLFLLWKTVGEIRDTFEGSEPDGAKQGGSVFGLAILQIMVIDLVFSLDSIITAIGMVEQVEVMIAAVVLSVGMMMSFAGILGRFVAKHPTIKMLALAFLVVVAVALIADGFGHHIPRGYIYSAMAFSAGVEMLNIRLRKRQAMQAGESDGEASRQAAGEE